MAVVFNKPYRVVSQFSASGDKQTLADYINLPDVYPAGRLDYDSEGLLVLTADGALQAKLTHPKFEKRKVYLVQVEGQIDEQALQRLRTGVTLKDGTTLPAVARAVADPGLWERTPPIRERRNIPVSWLELTIREGRNRQVRRMTAAVGFPTLRLVRIAVGPLQLGDLQPGRWKEVPDKEIWDAVSS